MRLPLTPLPFRNHPFPTQEPPTEAQSLNESARRLHGAVRNVAGQIVQIQVGFFWEGVTSQKVDIAGFSGRPIFQTRQYTKSSTEERSVCHPLVFSVETMLAASSMM
jgi:hypothetical protein